MDISPLYGRDCAARRRVVERIGRSAEANGFLCIEGHGVDQGLLERAKAEALAWFQRPLEEKMRHYIGNSRNHRGYVPQSEKGLYADEDVRLYEAFDLGLDLPASDPEVRAGHPLLGPNVWPEQQSFQVAVSAYYSAVSKLGFTLCGAFEEYLRVPAGTFSQHMRRPTSQLRLLHYLENDLAHKQGPMNMGAHTDYECFTILHQGGAGLEVLDPHNRWVAVPPMDGVYAVNIGDMFEAWTNGRFRATVHRVVNHGAERMSLPFFVAADYNAVVQPLDSLVERERKRYAPIVAGYHLLGQLLRDFPYLRARVDRGELRIPFSIPNGNPFEMSRLGLAGAAA